MGKVGTNVEVDNLAEITDVLPSALTASGNLKISLEEGGAGDGNIQDGVDSGIKATVLDYTSSNPLAVRLTDVNGDYVGAGAGTQYTDGDASATPTGTLSMGTDGSNVFGIITDASGHLQVDVLSGGGGGEQYVDATTVNATYKGNLVLGTDGSNYQILATDSSGNLQVDILSVPTTAVTGTFWQATQPVSGTFWQSTQPVSISGTVTVDLGTNNDVTVTSGAITETNSGTIAGDTTSIDGKITTCNTGAVVLATGTASIGKLATNNGVDIGDVTINNSSIAVTGTFYQSTQPVSGTFYQSTQPVSISQDIMLGTDFSNVFGTVDLISATPAIKVEQQGSVAVTGTFYQSTQPVSGTFYQATQPVSIAGTVAVDLGTNNDVTVTSGAITETNSGTIAGDTTSIDGKITTCNTGAVVISSGTVTAVTAITNALPTGTNTIGNVGIIPRTTGGATPYKLVSAASTNATSLKASAGQVFMITASNVNASACYLKFYNKASAPTVGTDTPILTLIIPGNTAGAGTNIPVPACGIAFGTGIAFATTTEATDAGTTGVASSEVVINIAYI